MADTNVIAVTFPEESKAYQALSELRQASEPPTRAAWTS